MKKTSQAVVAAGAVAALATLVPISLASAAPSSAKTTASTANLGTANYLPLARARKAADIALNAALKAGLPVTVTIVDRDGVIIDQERADTATGATVAVSAAKATAAVGFQAPTAALQDVSKTEPGLISISGFNILPGGLPITGAGKVIAGIGVSGAPTGEQDATFAQAAVDAINS